MRVHFASELPIRGKVRAAHRHFNWRRCPKTHDPAYDVAWFKRKAHVRQLLGKFFAQPFFQLFDAYWRARFQLHLQHTLFRPAVPEVNQAVSYTHLTLPTSDLV